MARVYANVNNNMPRSYWDYDSVNISKSWSSSPNTSFVDPVASRR